MDNVELQRRVILGDTSQSWTAPLPEFMATNGLDDYALRHAAELGRLRVQVELLRESLERYGRHSSWCLASTEAKRCTCGFEDARRVGQ